MKLLERHYNWIRSHTNDSMMRDLVPMDITPAAKWFISENKQESWSYRDDFPCILPPSPVTWLEYEMPLEHHHTVRAAAAMVLSLEVPEDRRADMLREDGLIDGYEYFLRESRTPWGIRVGVADRASSIEAAVKAGLEPKWIMFWQLFGEPPNLRALIPYVSYGLYADQNGQMIADLQIANVRKEKGADIEERHLRNAFADLLPYFFALSLTHCRNVEMVERETPPALAKKRKEKGIPELKFKHIVIKPMGGKRLIGGGQHSQNNNSMPLHFVRAHFKTFTEERKLFGRHQGTYFWHMQARGKQEQGEIVKEYSVERGN